jgi:hypothetical protein
MDRSGLATIPLGDSFSFYGRAGIARYQRNNTGNVQGVPIVDSTNMKPYFGMGLNFGWCQR